MRKWLVLALLAVGGVLGSSGKASAFFGCWGCGYGCNYARWCAPYACYPGGYYYPVYYPWYMYYNYYYSPYAPFVYQNYFFGLAANNPHMAPSVGLPTGGLTQTAPAAATVVASLPADAELLFNGVPATGGGATRAFQTGTLTPGQDYAYELTARVVRDGKVQTVTEKVIVKAGQETKVAFKLPTADTGVATASAAK